MRYFTDDEINRMRSGLIAMGQENNASMEILDAFEHQRAALYAIEKVIEGLDHPRKLEEQLADEVLLAFTGKGCDYGTVGDTKDFMEQLHKRLRTNLSSVLHDIAEMARAGAEGEDWTAVNPPLVSHA